MTLKKKEKVPSYPTWRVGCKGKKKMKEFRLGRSEYMFDPTATQAIANLDRRSDDGRPSTGPKSICAEPQDLNHLTRKESKRHRGRRKLIGNRLIKEWKSWLRRRPKEEGEVLEKI